ncbi:hypothetical protein TWF696_003913 [Orbilia brochopaga]|uniref:Uncharacterized protein n=1 Tax=Orbilia brochopaga TaxID=3140254 RepID=A0AAV9V7P5_9PEZI
MPPFSTFRQPNAAFPGSDLPSLTPESLLKTWWVTTSTLPMWKSAKNITITYTSIPSTPSAIDDMIHYQARSTTTAASSTPAPVKSIHGVDYPLTDNPTDLSYKWRGKGWLMIATSRWQVVGYGGRDVRDVDGVLEGVEWVLTYFEKSLFTPAGVDIMTLEKDGVDDETFKAIQDGLKGCGSSVLAELQGQMFDIPRD